MTLLLAEQSIELALRSLRFRHRPAGRQERTVRHRGRARPGPAGAKGLSWHALKPASQRIKWAIVNERHPRSPFQAIWSIDYTIIFVRDMAAMRRFYEDTRQGGRGRFKIVGRDGNHRPLPTLHVSPSVIRPVSRRNARRTTSCFRGLFDGSPVRSPQAQNRPFPTRSMFGPCPAFWFRATMHHRGHPIKRDLRAS